ncbi:MAG: hypothetical protein ACYS6I_01165, partial [Planctomycetota bacterium]
FKVYEALLSLVHVLLEEGPAMSSERYGQFAMEVASIDFLFRKDVVNYVRKMTSEMTIMKEAGANREMWGDWCAKCSASLTDLFLPYLDFRKL